MLQPIIYSYDENSDFFNIYCISYYILYFNNNFQYLKNFEIFINQRRHVITCLKNAKLKFHSYRVATGVLD